MGYFAVFDYPLTKEEIFKFVQMSKEELDHCLDVLLQQGVLMSKDGYYSSYLSDSIIERRKAGNHKANKLQSKARKNAQLISKFPYVRGVMISGSFSKGFMGEDGDIDYFIITKPGRLWIARTSLILYKKLFLLNSHEYFCVNYFVDENHLQIEEKNIFTATELITLLPMVNGDLYHRLIAENEWVNKFYPQFFHSDSNITDLSRSSFRNTSEKVLKGSFGNRLDKYFMRITLKKWQKKFGFLSNEDFDVAMKTTTNVSKHHPNNFQKKVLEKHQEIQSQLLDKLEKQHHVEITV